MGPSYYGASVEFDLKLELARAVPLDTHQTMMQWRDHRTHADRPRWASHYGGTPMAGAFGTRILFLLIKVVLNEYAGIKLPGIFDESLLDSIEVGFDLLLPVFRLQRLDCVGRNIKCVRDHCVPLKERESCTTRSDSSLTVRKSYF